MPSGDINLCHTESLRYHVKTEESVAFLSKWMMEEEFYLCVAKC